MFAVSVSVLTEMGLGPPMELGRPEKSEDLLFGLGKEAHRQLTRKWQLITVSGTTQE